MLVFLTGCGGQGKTTTARLLGMEHGWQVVLNEDHDVLDALDPKRRRSTDDELYLRFKAIAWERFEKRIRDCLNTPSRITVFDSCPFLYEAATLRRLCSCEDGLGPSLDDFGSRVQHLLSRIDDAGNKVLRFRPRFFFFPFDRLGEIEHDHYRSPSILSHMALAKIVLAHLVDHGCRYKKVGHMGMSETATWIARQVQATPRRSATSEVIGALSPSAP